MIVNIKNRGLAKKIPPAFARLREAIGPRPWREVAQRTATPLSSVYYWLRGRQPPAQFWIKAATEYRLSPVWLLTGEGERDWAPRGTVEPYEMGRAVRLTLPERIHREVQRKGEGNYWAVPVLKAPPMASAEAEIQERDIESFAIIYKEWVPRGRYTCFRIRGDSMEPTLPAGSLVCICHDDQQVNPGNIYALHDREAGATVIKRLFESDRKGIFVWTSDNPDRIRFPSAVCDKRKGEERFEILGRVCWAWTLFPKRKRRGR